MARAQAEALESIQVADPDGEPYPLTPEEARHLCAKHDSLVVASRGLARYLRLAEHLRLVALAARADIQERARRWIRAELARHPKGSERHVTLLSGLATIEGLEARRDAAETAAEQKLAAASADLLAQVEEAHADQELDRVLHEIHQDRMPEYEVLLRAARHLKKRLDGEPPADGRPRRR